MLQSKILEKEAGYIKPEVIFTNQNGNIYNLIKIASEALKHEDRKDLASELQTRILESKGLSYEGALEIIREYVEIF